MSYGHSSELLICCAPLGLNMVSGADGGVEASTGVSGGGANMPRRIVTAASLFDGHDAAINVMRRLIQAAGAEVIHLGHDRSAKDVVDTIIPDSYTHPEPTSRYATSYAVF